MRSKNSKAITRAEGLHLERVKSCACAVCDAPPPSEAHHISQGCHFATVALCMSCHRSSINGWHGQKVMWRIHKMDEIDALNETLRRVYALG